ncbi:hypothetical protein D1007_55287 [Hordeum vulgare]|nr:hypothetical protein D1007_55287 [Hordeum vulgare]
MEPCDGFTKFDEVALDKLAVWIQIVDLPPMYRKERVVCSLTRKVGEVSSVMLNPRWGNGRIVRVRVRLDVNEPLMRFVSITKNQRKVYYSILYEKMSVFCYVSGHMGHTFLEHGNGKHDKDSMAWGDWILATRPGGQSQGPRQNATVGSKLNPQGRAKSGRPLAKELQDDASSPHKVGDGTKYEDSGTGITGAVLQSDKGVFIASSCSAISFAEDVSSTEARALRDGLILASEVGVQKIIMESDCQDVIDTMLLDGNSLGPAAAVYK